MSDTWHVNERINRPAAEVYAYASNPANIPEWAPGLGTGAENVDGQWFVDTSMGRVAVTFAAENEFGVLDHDVRVPSGETIYNPMRVIPDGEVCDLVFTLRKRPDVSQDDFAADAAAVAADLARLKRLLEERSVR